MVLNSKSGETQSVLDMAHTAKPKGVRVAVISPSGSTLSAISNLNIDLDESVSNFSLYNLSLSQISTPRVIR